MTLLLLLLVAVQSTADHLATLTQVVETAEKFAVALTVLVSTGLGGLVIAWRAVMKRMRRVERKVEPVQAIADNAGEQTEQRNVEHLSNQYRLTQIEQEVRSLKNTLAVTTQAVAQVVANAAQTAKAVEEIRALLRLFVKQEGI